MASKPIKLYNHASGPNPWKVALVCEELGIPYESEFVRVGDIKKPIFVAVNPNGRLPAIYDPSTDLTLWESGAIVEYLVDNYDHAGLLQPSDLKDKYHARQWLYFQVSGQGPYFGQYAWFMTMHAEDVPSAKQRYRDEVYRVTKVLDTVLEGKDWLVANRYTYADLSLLFWYFNFSEVFAELSNDLKEKHPNFKRWMEAILARPATKKIIEDRQKAIDAGLG